jgi:DNA-binding HxlR family transcriptional regulator
MTPPARAPTDDTSQASPAPSAPRTAPAATAAPAAPAVAAATAAPAPSAPPTAPATPTSPAPPHDPCCPHYHQAVELLGQRWNGAIVAVLLDAPRPLRFTDLAAGIPEISDRLLAERLRQLAARGVVARTDDRPHRYALTPMGRDLEPAVAALTAWGRRWLDTSASSFRQA